MTTRDSDLLLRTARLVVLLLSMFFWFAVLSLLAGIIGYSLRGRPFDEWSPTLMYGAVIASLFAAVALAWWLTYRHLKLWLSIAAVTAVLLTLAAVALHVQGAIVLHRQWQAWQAKGHPTQLHDMLASDMAVDDEDNAAVWYQRAAAAAGPHFARSLATASESGDPGEFAQFVDAHADVLELLGEGARRDHMVWPAEAASGVEALPPLGPLRNLGTLATLAARVQMDRGDVAGAIDWLLVSARLGTHATQQPTILGHLQGNAIAARTLLTAEELFREQPADLSPLLQALRATDHREALRRNLLAEALLGQQLIDVEELGLLAGFIGSIGLLGLTDQADRPADRYRLLLPGELRRQYALCLAYCDEMSEFYARSPADRVGLPTPMEYNLEGAAFASVLLPAFSDYERNVTSIEVRLAQFDLALRRRAHRDQHGTYPDSLAGLREAAIDPGTGEPMSYTRNAYGFIVKSAFLESRLSRYGRPDDAEWRWTR